MGITVACLVFVLTAIVALYSGLTMSNTAGVESTGLMAGEEPVLNYLLLNADTFNFGGNQLVLVSMGLIFLAVAYFLWKENDLAWFFAVGLLTVSIVVDVVMIAFYGVVMTSVGMIALAVAFITLLALFHKDTISAVKPEMIDYPGWDLS